MPSEASACNGPYHRCGVAAGESRTNTVPKKRRNDKKSKKSASGSGEDLPGAISGTGTGSQGRADPSMP